MLCLVSILCFSCGSDNSDSSGSVVNSNSNPLGVPNPGNGFTLKLRPYGFDTNNGIFLMSVCVGSIKYTLGADPTLHSAPWSRKLIELNPNGTTLGNLGLPAGNYTKFVMELDDLCPEAYSVFVQNDHGAFFIPDTTFLNFVGSVNMTNTGTFLNLKFQNYVDLLDSVPNSPSVKPTIDSTNGEI